MISTPDPPPPPPPVPPDSVGLKLAKAPPKTSEAPVAPESPPQPPVSRSRLKKPSLSLRGWAVRLLVGAVVFGSGLLVSWSYARLKPVQAKAREMDAVVNRLAIEIASMEGRYSKEQIETLGLDYQRAQLLLFATPDALNDWFEEVRTQIVPLALDVSAEFGRPASTNTARHALAIVPATLSLNIQPSTIVEGVRSPYERLLRVLDRLNRQTQRVDVAELQVIGGSNSVARAVASLELWAGEENAR